MVFTVEQVRAALKDFPAHFLVYMSLDESGVSIRSLEGIESKSLQKHEFWETIERVSGEDNSVLLFPGR